jgi:DNA-binding response OmpR family regulator
MQRGKIVLIDDDPTSNFLSKFILNQINSNVEVLVWVTCDEILKELSEFSFQPNDLLLVDINLGLCSGWDVLDRIEAKHVAEPLTMPAIVMLSSSINTEDRLKADNYSCVRGFITKPLTYESVVSFMLKQNSL